MRSPLEMDSIAIEICDACHNSCSNCSQLCGHKKPGFMTLKQAKAAIDSMVGFKSLTNIQGGEPLLHPQFEEICDYAVTKIPPEQLGITTTLPRGYERYRAVIARTFGNILLNDHTRNDIMHKPGLVAAQDVKGLPDWMKWYLIDKCWMQCTWSAAISPRGAFFCEVASALDRYLPSPGGWPVEHGWWRRTPKDFVQQIEAFCWHCGQAMPLQMRESTDGRDDISESNMEYFKDSPKIKAKKYVPYDGSMMQDCRPMFAYKDPQYRAAIAARYGLFLVVNDRLYERPYLMKDFEMPKQKGVRHAIEDKETGQDNGGSGAQSGICEEGGHPSESR